MSASLKVECPHCFGSLKLKDRSADGKKVRCPKCQEVFKVELPVDDLDDVEDLDDFGDDFGGDDELPEEDESPRRSKGGSKKSTKKKRKSGGAGIPWLIIAIAAVALFAVGGVVFVVTQFASGGGSNKIDLTYLPPDANMVMHLKVGDLFNSPLLSSAINQPAAQQMLQEQTKNMGVSVKEMVSVTVGSVVDESSSALKLPQMGPMGMNRFQPSATPSHTITVIRCSAPLKAEDIGIKMMKGVAQTHGGQTYYKKANGEVIGQSGGDSLYFPESTVAVLGMETDIKQVIDRGPKQTRRKEYDFVNPDKTLLVAFAPKSIPNPSETVTAPPSQPNLQALERASNKTFRAGAFGIKITDRVDLEILVKCADSAGAGEIKSATDAIFADLKRQFEKTKTLLALVDMNDVASLGDTALASLKADQSGTLVTAVGSIPSEIKTVGENLAKKLPGMMGMGMGMPGGGLGGGRPLTPPGSSGGVPPAGFPDPSQLPPGAFPPGTLPPGTLPPGTVPPGTVPPGTLPPGTVPPMPPM